MRSRLHGLWSRCSTGDTYFAPATFRLVTAVRLADASESILVLPIPLWFLSDATGLAKINRIQPNYRGICGLSSWERWHSGGFTSL
jgi:hypothetical protein